MRTAPLINDLWSRGGPFHGEDGKPHSRVTVQMPWEDISTNPENAIFPESIHVGLMKSRGTPLRWYQREDNDQIEREVPNIKSIRISRSIEADAATCSISMYNQWMFDNGAASVDAVELGQPGYFTPTRGVSPQAQSRWGQETNEWEDILVPNAILRTYQGFGGTSKSINDAIVDGNIILTGVWLVDQVDVGSDGMLNITCRDMMKLLIEQQLYPPLVPPSRYPLKYFRYVSRARAIAAAAITRTDTVQTTTNIAPGDKRTVYVDSSVDRWYPSASPGSRIPQGGYVLHGHKATDCLDGDPGTFCVSVGNSRPTNPFAVDMWEFDCGEHMNAVYVHPWGGNYTMYVSVMENGVWQGSDTVPYYYDSNMNGGGRAVDTGVDIPYVASFGVPWETAQEFILPRAYHAQKVRVAFANPTRSEWGPYLYRSGMREFRIRASNAAGTLSSTSTVTTVVPPIFYGADALRRPDDLNANGYMTLSQHGQVDAFGELDIRPQVASDPMVYGPGSIINTSTGLGYWILNTTGRISAFGDAGFFGSPFEDLELGDGVSQWCGFAPTVSNQGYWVVHMDGRVREYGDATPFSDITVPAGEIIHRIDRHPEVDGFLAILSNGSVVARGPATALGNFTEAACAYNSGTGSRICTDIQHTRSGDGYWVLASDGRVQAFGDAVDWGQINAPVATTDNYKRFYQLLPDAGDVGFLLIQGDGVMVAFGDADNFGGPIPGGHGLLRRDGNYKDYSDIIKELALWSGFLLWDDDVPNNEMPPVFGNIETTGAFSELDLPDDIFDKRPVIDAINELKETVGYLCFIDDEGGFRFESPNWWSQGNFNEIGERLTVLPEIDERVNMTNYSVNHNDTDLRSVIIIASEDPDEAGTSTLSTRLRPATAAGLRGLEKPAMWVNGFFQTKDDQAIMAELISMHIWFAQRMASVQCVANPCIQINDQVRIYERQTSDAYIHYVRGIDTDHDLDTGKYTMSLTTHWLGDGDQWVIMPNDSVEFSGSNPRTLFLTTPRLTAWLNAHPSERIRDSVGILAEGASVNTSYSEGDPPDEIGVATP